MILLIQIKHQYQNNEILKSIVENYLDEIGKGKTDAGHRVEL